MGTPNLALVRYRRLANTFMGASIGKKIEDNSVEGFSIGDFVSHSKIGTSAGRILYFCEFNDGMYAVVDYGSRRRVERIVDLLPMRKDIYGQKVRDDCESAG